MYWVLTLEFNLRLFTSVKNNNMSVVEVPIAGSNRTITIDAYKSRSLKEKHKNDTDISEVDNLLTLMCEQQPKIQMNAKVVTINKNNQNLENNNNNSDENLIKLDTTTTEEEIEHFESINNNSKDMRSTIRPARLYRKYWR